MKKELGKWFVDIAKYLTIAVILIFIFGDIQSNIMLYGITIIIITYSLGLGIWLIRNKKIDKKEI